MRHDSGPAFRAFRREEGVLARTDENGDEIRLHFDEGSKRWHVHRWRADPTSPDGWHAPVAYGFTLEDLAALGAVAMALPVAAEAATP